MKNTARFPRTHPLVKASAWTVVVVLSVILAAHASAQDKMALRNLQSLRVQAEDWCTKYDRQEYPYPRTIEQRVIVAQGGMFSPYDLTCFRDQRESDVEHIVALAEAHRSGMCARSVEEKARFATDLLNLTLATPELNRAQKIAKDASEWLPAENRCWYAARIVAVKKKYRLTVDQAEKRALHKILRSCQSSELTRPRCG